MARVYKLYDRTKIPRNKYGTINNYNSIGGTSFYSSDSISQVGAEMPNLNDFLGATSTEDGVRGLVPAPEAGQNNWYYLRGNGAWDYIPAAKWLHEWPKDEGLDKRGLGIDGDFNVSDTLSTTDLNVTGRAHFVELVIDKCRANGGQIMVSPSLFQIDAIGDIYNYSTSTSTEIFQQIREKRPDIVKWLNRYSFTQCRARRLWMKNEDGVDRTYNEVEIGDMMRCRTFNLDGHVIGEVMQDVSNTDYWTFVCGTGKGKFFIEYEDGPVEYDGIYIDLAFALTGNNSTYSYVPIDTLFSEGDNGENTVEIPDSFIDKSFYNDLKEWTFNTLCGSTTVEEELIEDEETESRIIDYDFKIRGVTYITAGILGVEYVDDSYASLYALMQAENIAGYILYGSDADNIEEAVRKILGVDVDPYAPIAGFEMNYANDITDETLNGNTGFEYSEDGTYDPEFNTERENIADRKSWRFGYGVFEPRVGQHLACLGHMYDPDRQNAIIISSNNPLDAELIPPCISQYNGIDIFGSISQFRLSVIAKNGNIFTGKFMAKDIEDGSYLSLGDTIDMYIQDIYTGLEVCGIHLDGLNSTILMRGSVELHQHSDKDDDTLSVWDSHNNKKVEIIPTEIPARGSVDQTNEYKFATSKSSDMTVSSSSGCIRVQQKFQKSNGELSDSNGFLGLGNRTKVWLYSIGWSDEEVFIPPYEATMSFDMLLGSYKQGDTVDINGVQLVCNLMNAKLNGSYNVPLYTYGYTASYFLTLKRDGTVVTNKSENNVPIPEDTQDFTIPIGNLLDDYQPSHTNLQQYSLELTISFKVWTNNEYYKSYTEYSSYYFTISPYCTFSCNVISNSSTSSFMTIGTNGLVYSVGNGDYFYAGADGFEYKYKGNRIVMADGTMKVMHEPQVLSNVGGGSLRIKSEIVIAQYNGTGYTISFDSDLESGRRFSIFGFHGLTIASPTSKRFKIWRNDVNAYSTFDSIVLSNNSLASNGMAYINTGYKVELVTLDDGIYVLSTII